LQPYEPDEDDTELEEEPDAGTAWCQACEDYVVSVGEWTDAVVAFSDMKVVCEFCFHDALLHHTLAEYR
jgi:hypothetical protein